MHTIDILEETYTALAANKIRTSLTMLGIVIGIASVIAMIAIGQGAQKTIQDRIQSIGSNLIIVMPGSQQGGGSQVSTGRGTSRTLTLSDAEAIEENPLVAAVAPQTSGRYQAVGKGSNTNTTVSGVTPDYEKVRNITLSEGDFISEEDVDTLSRVAVIGPTVRDDLFGSSTTALGKNIRINGTEFRVIGITESKGGNGLDNQDDSILLPLSSMQQFVAGNAYLSTISIQIVDADSMTLAQESITQTLLEKHRIKDSAQADFSVLNQADIVQTASSVTQTFTILLGSVAGISLLVGGIGIMNMMLTTVTERTKEIGLRKAIGGKRGDVIKQFLAEAIALTTVGGLIGVALGTGASFLITKTGVLQTSVSFSSVLLAFFVSAAIGIIFGYYPARRAANLNVIEALRYE